MPVDKAETRSIKSFVRRSGRITPSQRYALQALWPKYGIDFGTRFPTLPDRFGALKLEIGIGNGDALISMAAEDPQSLYFGIEVHEPGIGRCLNLIQQQQLDNVRLLKHDAVEVMQQMVPAGSLDRVLLFFPDPWHKKRHHKRRIVNPDFLDLIYQALKPAGVFHAATDWQDYAQWMAAQFLGDPRFTNNGDSAGYAPCPRYRPQTRFERRGRRLGHGVWDLLFTKI